MSYDWKKTAKKFVWAFVEIIIAGGIAYFTKQQIFLFLIPVFEALRNFLKHHNK